MIALNSSSPNTCLAESDFAPALHGGAVLLPSSTIGPAIARLAKPVLRGLTVKPASGLRRGAAPGGGRVLSGAAAVRVMPSVWLHESCLHEAWIEEWLRGARRDGPWALEVTELLRHGRWPGRWYGGGDASAARLTTPADVHVPWDARRPGPQQRSGLGTPARRPRCVSVSKAQRLTPPIQEEALRAQPGFPLEVTPSVLESVWQHVERAAMAPGLCAEVPDSLARERLSAVAGRLKLGQLDGSRLWLQESGTCPWLPEPMDPVGPMGGCQTLTVAHVRARLQGPALALPRPLQNLLILTFAARTGQRVQLQGQDFLGPVESLADEAVLRPCRLPDENTWQEARCRAAALFGVEVRPECTVAHVRQLVKALGQRACALCEPLAGLAVQLRTRLTEYGADANQAPRLKTVAWAATLVEQLTWQSGVEALELLVTSPIETSCAAFAASLSQAPALEALLCHFPGVFRELSELTDGRRGEAQQLLSEIRTALAADEHQVALKARIGELERRARSLRERHSRQAMCQGEAGLAAVRALLAQIEGELAAGASVSLSCRILQPPAPL